MVYKNKNGQPRERAMVAAYSLVTEFGASQASVGAVLGCSQGTISNWVKSVEQEAEIRNLTVQLQDAQTMIQDLRQEVMLLEHNEIVSSDYESNDDEGFDDVPDYGYESDDDNFEHAFDDILKANDM